MCDSRHQGARCVSFAALLFSASAGLASEVPYSDPWDAVSTAAAEGAVSRLGAKNWLALNPTILRINGLEVAVGGKATSIVGTVQGLQKALRELNAQETSLEVRVELPADVLFDFDKADIRPDAEAALSKVALVIRSYPTSRVRLEGHTDSKGDDRYNQKLSERRAQSVRDWLVQKGKIDAARLIPLGFGETKPVATNDTDEGRQKNRRLDVVIEKQ
jgi:outer membrane protein OmpA-like peptidoglycan-associated protein